MSRGLMSDLGVGDPSSSQWSYPIETTVKMLRWRDLHTRRCAKDEQPAPAAEWVCVEFWRRGDGDDRSLPARRFSSNANRKQITTRPDIRVSDDT